FLGMLREMPEASFSLLASMSRRLHMLVNQIESLTLQNATYRLVTYLLEQLPGGSATAPEIQLSVPKSVIAARLAIQPETLSRIVARVRQGGLVELHGAHIAAPDVQALRKLVHMPPEGDTPAERAPAGSARRARLDPRQCVAGGGCVRVAAGR